MTHQNPDYAHNKNLGTNAAQGAAGIQDIVHEAIGNFETEGGSFFRPYVLGYIAEKVAISGIGPDENSRKLLAEPICAVLLNARDPQAVLTDIVSDLARDDRQKVLNLVLQSAYTPELAETVITVGADPNAFHGMAVAKALEREIDKPDKMLIVFNKHGGNLRLANESYALEIPPACLQSLGAYLNRRSQP